MPIADLDLLALAQALAADLATLHRAGSIAALYRHAMRAIVGGAPRRWDAGDDMWVNADAAHGRTYHKTWSHADLSDPVTCAALLPLAREALGSPLIHIAPRCNGGWTVWRLAFREGNITECTSIARGPTEVAALCAAIHAAAATVTP